MGRSVRNDIAEYRQRSPVNHAKELQTPLLIHTNTNDEDVNVEVLHLMTRSKPRAKSSHTRFTRTLRAATTSTARTPNWPGIPAARCTVSGPDICTR
jgi:hypothetical protein